MKEIVSFAGRLCVERGKVTFTGNQLYNAHKINLKKGDDKDDKVRSNCRI
ncbi:hypothetical protein KsCSTR_04730 [Candidatus Kuenenia stuttgartiensis]|uniref:Uncharacterized protein n=1 Tax=Kuenenia stuttgartiensis TaxID=174633 RepID=A0A6G7GKH0_KUEST|nr:hypothetical protein KsCSTR_04730 [Candidatus Kuenenia stuttgartiensis]GJQ50034.1 MAG: hypothetical protein HKUEN01_24200 [Candidatus Kuenenia stuttgartiensis]